jgi:predicted phosphodiesterase
MENHFPRWQFSGRKTTGDNMARTLVIGDLHCPAVHQDYLAFCKSVQKKFKTDQTIFIGDIADNEAVSNYEKNPELPGGKQMYMDTLESINQWKKAFPKALVVIGNHDKRIHNKASKHGISPLYLKSYQDLYDTPGWEWDISFAVDGVMYVHGDGWASEYPAFNAAKASLQSVVSGHSHTKFSINWIKGPNNRPYFGMNVGSGVDITHPVFRYSTPHLKKAILGCGVVIDGKNPYLEIMHE